MNKINICENFKNENLPLILIMRVLVSITKMKLISRFIISFLIP